MCPRSSFCIAVFALLWSAPAARAAFTIEQVMQTPFASELSANPAGDRVAWVLFEQGKRNIYVAAAPDWKARKATSFNEDDGQEIDQIVWSRDGSALFFTRGGDFEMERGIPNPALSVTKPDQSIWILRMDGSAPAKLVEGSAAETCRGNSGIVYLKAGQIWEAAADGSGPRQLVSLKGKASELTCSPDGSELAFVDGRKTHSLIGIYSFAQRTLQYPDPSVDEDGSPIWSPDGKQLAFLRIPANTHAFEFGPVRQAQPFSIRVIDIAGAKARRLWKADEGAGSAFSHVVAAKQLFWGVGDEIVFPWEKTGWKLLYSVPLTGGAARALSSDDAEVEHVALSKDRATIYYSTNKNDIDRRHIWQAPVNGSSAPREITSGDGIEWSPVPLAAAGSLALLASDARHSSHAALEISGGKPRALSPETIPADFPASQLVVPQQVILSASDGLPIHGQLFLPPHAAKGEKLPALLFFHGGSRRQMLLGFHYKEYYSNAYCMNQYLASKGYIVLPSTTGAASATA